jgi:hypothetical protein
MAVEMWKIAGRLTIDRHFRKKIRAEESVCPLSFELVL